MADKAGETKSVGSALNVRAFVSKSTSKAKAAYLRVRALRAAPLDRKVLAAAAAGLLIGTALGFAGASRDHYRDEMQALRGEIGAGRGETARIVAMLDRDRTTMAEIRERLATASSEAERRDAVSSDRSERLNRNLATLHEDLRGRSDMLGREHAERIAELARTIEWRLQEAAQAAQAKPEPARTGSIGEAAAAAPETIEEWALREVLDGVATIQDRKRRLVEVARGDLVPGIGRVEAVERRGRSWTVVTKRGLITPQGW
ncbi:hypothetical protein [Methylorubrum extorquens]|uniref:Uncharacterized protein n=1 Tax=Methylorubrum extorquens DSM 13060 TaxID=882800 RepID=H1KCP8_METEX|nr:hypothetical protein [Methylorubrum extorquens]EHP94721.1 hypothetical protein MetexDRAFT_0410 [Methylorubrum extorquens DSM 13060]